MLLNSVKIDAKVYKIIILTKLFFKKMLISDNL